MSELKEDLKNFPVTPLEEEDYIKFKNGEIQLEGVNDATSIFYFCYNGRLIEKWFDGAMTMDSHLKPIVFLNPDNRKIEPCFEPLVDKWLEYQKCEKFLIHFDHFGECLLELTDDTIIRHWRKKEKQILDYAMIFIYFTREPEACKTMRKNNFFNPSPDRGRRRLSPGGP